MSFIQDFLNKNLSSEINQSLIHSCVYNRNNKKLREIFQLQKENIEALVESTSRTLTFPITIELPNRFKEIAPTPTKPILFDLDKPATPYGLTPLHIAIITRNFKAVKLLCRNGADINKLDVQGWSPLHHAATLCSQKFFQLLCDQGADKTQKNLLNGTPENLRQMVTAADLPSEEIAIPFVIEKKQTKINGNVFKCLTNATFIKEVSMTSDMLYRKWTDLTRKVEIHPDIKPFMPDVWLKDYYRLLENPVKLFLQEARDPQTGKSVGLGVFAGNKISKGKLFCEYLGKIVDDGTEEKDTTYLLRNIQSLNYRNLGPMINDGFPNAVMIGLDSINGMEKRSVLIALEDINPGEEIFWDYGASDLKIYEHRELNMEAARKFFKQHPILEIVKKTEQVMYFMCNYDYPHLGDFSRALYLMNTPTTAIKLYLEGIVSFKELQLLATQPYCSESNFTLYVNPLFIPFVKFYESQSHTFKEVLKEAVKKYFDKGKPQTIYSIFRNFSLLSKFTNYTREDLKFILETFFERLDKEMDEHLKTVRK